MKTHAILANYRNALVFLMVITFVGVSAASALAATGPTAAEYGVVLNLSGKQRMLTQKMSKEIMLVALDVDKAANLNNLAATASLFDKTLKGLRDGDTDLRLPETSNGRIRRQLDKVDKIWIDFHTVVKQIVDSGTVSPEQIENVATQNLPLLKEMNKCVNLYEKDASGAGLKADPALAVTINLSGKQRMLTQKMSKEFLLVALDHDRQTNKLNLLETYTLFERTLKGLKDGDATLDLPGTPNETIRRQLDIVDGLWKDFKQVVSYAAESATTSVPREKIDQLAAGNLPLLSEMNNAVGMYEKEAAK